MLCQDYLEKMGGINIEQWRGNIGIFNRKKCMRICKTGSNDFDSFSTEYIYHLLNFFYKSVKLISSLILLFSYCSMVLFLFPTLLMTRLSMISVFANDIGTYPNQSLFSYIQPIQIFLEIHLLPRTIAFRIASLFSFFKNLSKPVTNIMFFIFVLQTLLVISGTIEINPGPTTTMKSKLSFAVWNLDSLPARNYARIPLIESFQASYDFDLFGICESCLTSDIMNENIFIEGFAADPLRADKSVNIRNGGVCLYFKEDLPITQRCDLETLPETIVAEVKLNRKKIFLVLSYCHPTLTKEDFDNYTTGLENIYKNINKENPAITIITGDFNARSPLFWENDNENSHG